MGGQAKLKICHQCATPKVLIENRWQHACRCFWMLTTSKPTRRDYAKKATRIMSLLKKPLTKPA